METVKLGSISSGTLRSEDLLETYVDQLILLECQSEHLKDAKYLLKLIFADAKLTDEQTELMEDLVNESLIRELASYAPPYCYFGCSEGDGSDIGFWIAHEYIDECVQDGTLLRVQDLSEIPSDYSGDVILINDHGNMALYQKTDWKETWSIV